jgi:ubiquinone/menaquinone biosynthesis C-methylase UbiE
MRNKDFCVLDDHPLEELPFPSESFDLAVKINVLDHVRDAHLCMDNFIRILKPGGIVIWGQDLTNAEGVKRTASGVFVGHPIIVDEEFCKPYLEQFDPIISEIVPAERPTWAPDWHYATLVFAGTKSGGAARVTQT